jgi:dTDP-4-dehydrorhamnose 3,5-epimerase
LKVTPLAIPDVLLIEPDVYGDARGYFFESYRDVRYSEAGVTGPFVQDNQSFSQRNVLRGIHYQWPQNRQGKLVSVAVGAVWDVAVDLRRGSNSFGRWVAAELSAENHRQLWVPPGFGHGFVVVSASALFCYKCTAPYSPADERSIIWNDPTIGIEWPISIPLVSDKDAKAPTLDSIGSEFLPRL